MGGSDVGAFSSFFRLGEEVSWECSFHHHLTEANELILSVYDFIFEESLKEEIVATIKDKLKNKYKVLIWMTKRATKRLYDSLSIHGFIIGCRTKI